MMKMTLLLSAITLLVCALRFGATTAYRLEGLETMKFGQNNDNVQQCVQMVSNKTMSKEQLERIDHFQRGWFDQDRFPPFNITPEERWWLFNMSAMPFHSQLPKQTPGARSPSFEGNKIKRSAVTAVPDCYKIPSPMRVRKEYRQLSSEERTSLHNALNKMKTEFPFKSKTSAYDFLVTLHRYRMAPTAHGGASFLPWHRQYLFTFENVLFKHGFSGPGLPYWDSTLDQALPDPSASALWTPSYMGNNYGEVTTGPAKGWDVTPGCGDRKSTKLQREMIPGEMGNYELFSDTDLSNVYSKKCFKDISCQEDCFFEGKHGSVHNNVGGQMSNVICSPNDPIFFMHHSFVDCIWEEFRQHHQESDREREYPSHIDHGDNIGPVNRDQGPFEWNQPMKPFDDLINADGLSDRYTTYYYQCQARPNYCLSDSECASDILWCDTKYCRCRAKVRVGGDCTGLTDGACAGPCPDRTYPRCSASTNKCTCMALSIIDKLELLDELIDATRG